MCLMTNDCNGMMKRTGFGTINRNDDGEIGDIHYEYKCEECGETEEFL